jgi:hypothetical protein
MNEHWFLVHRGTIFQSNQCSFYGSTKGRILKTSYIIYCYPVAEKVRNCACWSILPNLYAHAIFHIFHTSYLKFFHISMSTLTFPVHIPPYSSKQAAATKKQSLRKGEIPRLADRRTTKKNVIYFL